VIKNKKQKQKIVGLALIEREKREKERGERGERV
jgi:hypothetical protein